MARIIGNSSMAFNFEPTAQAPLDARLVVETIKDLTAPETYIAKNYYKGMTVTVQEDGSIWTLLDPENIVSLDSWVRQTAGKNNVELKVIDNVETDDASNPLSARQGKILAEGLKEINDKVGAPNGIATLDEGGKVPASQLPSFVDDILEFDSMDEFPEEGESGKIYVDKSTNTTWRWGGTEYANVGSSLAIGETSESAFAGDRGVKLEGDVKDLQDDVKKINEEAIPELKGNIEKELDKKVEWSNASKTTIVLPSNGSIEALKPGQGEEENPEKNSLIAQISEEVEGKQVVTTEVGSSDNELVLNSKSGKVIIRTEQGDEKTVAYVEDLKKSQETSEEKIEELKEAFDELSEVVGKPAVGFDEATGFYKALDEGLSWYEEKVLVKWDGTSKTTPRYDEANETYLVGEASELAWLADNVPALDGKTIVLTSDIDLNNHSWKPIGTSKGAVKTNPDAEFFKGIFDGKGHIIKNLNCEIVDDYAKVGLFGAFQGTVKNLVVDGANLKSTHYTGVFVPYNTDGACTIENCEARNINIIDTPAINVDGQLDNGDKAGTIAGYISSDGSKIVGCKASNVFIKAYRDLGGIVGYVGLTKLTVEISNNYLKNVNLVQDVTNGYKDFEKVRGHAGTLYGWKDNNTIISSGNIGEANIIVIGSPE